TGYNALQIGFDGLQTRQSVRLLAENGTLIDQTMQTGTATVWLSFNSALTGPYAYYENGDNAKTVVKIYGEDGTLEYQSPLTRFFVGEKYAYTRPTVFADELVKTRSGALFWPNTIYADDSCGGIQCLGTWMWQQSPTIIPLRGTYAHVTPFDYGYRWHALTFSAFDATAMYFVTYVRIPEGKGPDGIQFMVSD